MKSYRFQHLIKQIQNNKLKNNMKKLFLSFLMMLTLLPLAAANKYDNPD
jgi:hypothetical protein